MLKLSTYAELITEFQMLRILNNPDEYGYFTVVAEDDDLFYQLVINGKLLKSFSISQEYNFLKLKINRPGRWYYWTEYEKCRVWIISKDCNMI